MREIKTVRIVPARSDYQANARFCLRMIRLARLLPGNSRDESRDEMTRDGFLGDSPTFPSRFSLKIRFRQILEEVVRPNSTDLRLRDCRLPPSHARLRNCAGIWRRHGGRSLIGGGFRTGG